MAQRIGGFEAELLALSNLSKQNDAKEILHDSSPDSNSQLLCDSSDLIKRVCALEDSSTFCKDSVSGLEGGLKRVTEQSAQGQGKLEQDVSLVLERLGGVEKDLNEALHAVASRIPDDGAKQAASDSPLDPDCPNVPNEIRALENRVCKLESGLEQVTAATEQVQSTIDQRSMVANRTPRIGNLPPSSVTPRLDALERRMSLQLQDEVHTLKGDIDHVQETSKGWVHSLTKHTEQAVGSLQQQFVRALNGGASASPVSSSHRSGSNDSRHDCDEEDDIQSSSSRGRAASPHRDSLKMEQGQEPSGASRTLRSPRSRSSGSRSQSGSCDRDAKYRTRSRSSSRSESC